MSSLQFKVRSSRKVGDNCHLGVLHSETDSGVFLTPQKHGSASFQPSSHDDVSNHRLLSSKSGLI